MKKILILLFVTAVFNLSAQRSPDSLRKTLEDFPYDTIAIKSLLQLAKTEKKSDLGAAAEIYSAAYARAKFLKNRKLLGSVSQAIASNYCMLGEYTKAAAFLIEAQSIAEERADESLMMRCYLTWGNIYSFNDQRPKALEMYHKALALCEKIGDEMNISTILNNIAGVIYAGSRYDSVEMRKALGYFLRSASIDRKMGNHGELVTRYSNIGLMYCDLKIYDSALHYLGLSRKTMQGTDYADDLLTYYLYTGRVYSDLHQFERSEEHLRNGLEQAKKLRNYELLYECYAALSDMFRTKGDYKSAVEFFQLFHDLRDSVVSTDNFARAIDLQNRFEREKKEAELKMLKAEQAKNRVFSYSLIAVSALLILSALMMYSRFRIKALSEKQLRQQNEIILQKNKDITDSINYSRKIQDAISPSQEQLSELFAEHFVLYKPKDIISGDFYWCAKSGHYSFFAVADCTGHGVPGALMSMLGTSLLKEIVLTRHVTEPAAILNQLRSMVIAALGNNTGNKDGMDISLVRFNPSTGELVFSGANNSGLLVTGGRALELKANKQPVGMYEKMNAFLSEALNITAPSMLFLFTDGFADQFGGPKGKKFKYRQLENLLIQIAPESAGSQKNVLAAEFERWKGPLEQVDDVCVVGVRLG